MKKHLKFLSLCLLVAIGFSSCDTDDDGTRDDAIYVGGYAYPSDRSITLFDTNANLNINLFTDAGVSVESVDIMQGGSVLTSATVSGETASFNSSVFGDIAVDDEFDLRVKTTLSNGNVVEDPFTVVVSKALELDEDNPTALSLSSLADATLVYEISTFSATVDAASLWLKKNDAGTYADSGADVAINGEEVALSDTNYDELNLAVNDTLYYQFNVSSGTLSQSEEGMIVIVEEETED